jgi:type II restriction enzyme
MHALPYLTSLVGAVDEDAVFDYLMGTLSPSVYDFSYLMNCSGAQEKALMADAAIPDFCEAMSNVDWPERLFTLLQCSSQARKLGKMLLAYRKPAFVRLSPGAGAIEAESLDLSLAGDLHKTLLGTGVIEFLEGIREDALRSLLLGIELGLDSNGRKNRGGHAMEFVVGEYLETLCASGEIKFEKECSTKRIVDLGWATVGDINSYGTKRFDFAMRYKGRVTVIETNYYSSSGSKLKATAEEYARRGEAVRNSPVRFVWITDGMGWKSACNPLRQAHVSLNFLFNLNMMRAGALIEVLNT